MVPARIPGLGDLARALLSGLGQLSERVNPKAPGLLKYGGTYAGAYLLRRGLFMPERDERFLSAIPARMSRNAISLGT